MSFKKIIIIFLSLALLVLLSGPIFKEVKKRLNKELGPQVQDEFEFENNIE